MSAVLDRLARASWRATVVLPAAVAPPAVRDLAEASWLIGDGRDSRPIGGVPGSCWAYAMARVSRALGAQDFLVLEDAVPARMQGTSFVVPAPVQGSVVGDTQYWWLPSSHATPAAVASAFQVARNWLCFGVVTSISPWSSDTNVYDAADSASLFAIDALDDLSVVLVEFA